MAKITVQNTAISVIKIGDEDYISLTDMATAKNGDNRFSDIFVLSASEWIDNTNAIGVAVRKGCYGET